MDRWYTTDSEVRLHFDCILTLTLLVTNKGLYDKSGANTQMAQVNLIRMHTEICIFQMSKLAHAVIQGGENLSTSGPKCTVQEKDFKFCSGFYRKPFERS